MQIEHIRLCSFKSLGSHFSSVRLKAKHTPLCAYLFLPVALHLYVWMFPNMPHSLRMPTCRRYVHASFHSFTLIKCAHPHMHVRYAARVWEMVPFLRAHVINTCACTHIRNTPYTCTHAHITTHLAHAHTRTHIQNTPLHTHTQHTLAHAHTQHMHTHTHTTHPCTHTHTHTPLHTHTHNTPLHMHTHNTPLHVHTHMKITGPVSVRNSGEEVSVWSSTWGPHQLYTKYKRVCKGKS